MFYLVNGSGDCENLPVLELPQARPYRLYRFLTDLEEILADTRFANTRFADSGLVNTGDDRQRLMAICPLVVRLLQDSIWLQLPDLVPDRELGWAVQTLYDEPTFPLTVQLVAWQAGFVSPVHNHGTWGLVAVMQGQEKNTLWRRQPSPAYPDRVVPSNQRIVHEGEIIAFLPDAIHQVEIVGDQPAISFNLYGETQYNQRWEFNLQDNTASLF